MNFNLSQWTVISFLIFHIIETFLKHETLQINIFEGVEQHQSSSSIVVYIFRYEVTQNFRWITGLFTAT